MDKDVSDFYGTSYSSILGTGILGYVQRLVHRAIDQTLNENFYSNILEVGAGKLEHLQFSKLLFKNYTASDIQLKDGSLDSKLLGRKSSETIKTRFVDAQRLPFDDNSFDVLIATCLLIHLQQPEAALKEWRRVVKDSGEIVVYVPCDPGMLLRIARNIAVLPKHLLYKSRNYRIICAREHISSLHVLKYIIKYTFQRDKIKVIRWPFMIPSWNSNLAYIFHVQVNKTTD